MISIFIREISVTLFFFFFALQVSVMATNPGGKFPAMEDEAEDPKCAPMFWVSKWVDYSDKYGFGYALCDESIGVVFNDLTKLLLLSDGT